MNCNGLRTARYALIQMNRNESGFEIVAEYDTLYKNVSYQTQMRFPTGEAPLDTPTCGFDMSKCPRMYFYKICTSILNIHHLVFSFQQVADDNVFNDWNMPPSGCYHPLAVFIQVLNIHNNDGMKES